MADLPSDLREAWSRVAQRAIEGPLARVVAGLEAVEGDAKSSLTPATRQTARASLAAARRLADMLGSLIAAGRRLAGGTALEPAPVTLTTALAPAIAALEARAAEAGAEFDATALGTGLAVAGDEDLLRRAFRLAAGRIMDDAGQGSVVRVSTLRAGGTIRVRVTGSAVAADGGAFSLVEPAEFEFARLAVEAMGGRMHTERSPDTGSLVEIDLLADGAPAPTPAPRSEPAVPVRPVATAPSLPSVPAVEPPPLQVPAVALPPLATPDLPSAPPPPEPAPAPRSAGPHLEGMTITAPWTAAPAARAAAADAPPPAEPGRPAAGRRTGETGSAFSGEGRIRRSARPPGAEEPAESPPADPGDAAPTKIKIVRSVDFDILGGS